MNSIVRLASCAALAASLVSFAGAARADALPPDTCPVENIGQACSNAGDQGDEPGICTQTTCTRFNPADGGEITSDCTLCEPTDGGTADAGGGDGGSSGDGGGATTTRPDGGGSDAASTSSSSSGCSLSSGDRDGAAGFGMLMLGIVGLSLSRRKRA